MPPSLPPSGSQCFSMAESLPSLQSVNPSPSKSESDNPMSHPNRQPDSAPQPIPSAPTAPPPALNHSSVSNPPTVPTVPAPVPLYGPPAVSGAPLFRPALPQFTPVPGAVSYQNPSVSSAPGMANPAAPGAMMPYQVQVPVPVPVPGQPQNPTLRPYMPVPNGFGSVPPPGGLSHLPFTIALTKFVRSLVSLC